jgi:hypothetical protein
LEHFFRENKDRRAVFVTAYALITREIKQRVESNRFEDGVWVTRYAVDFANLYRLALARYEERQRSFVAKSWIVSFNISSQGQALLIQDLVLGINAHVNHDLPLALEQVSIDPNREIRHRDHNAVNDALKTTTIPVMDQIEKMYAPGLTLFNLLPEAFEQEITGFKLEKAREHAWREAVALANSHDELERRQTRQDIDDEAGVLAHLIVAPTATNPLLLDLLRHIEQLQPWWECVSLPKLIQPT